MTQGTRVRFRFGRDEATSQKGRHAFDYRGRVLSETILTTIVALMVLVLVYSLLSENPDPVIVTLCSVSLVIVAFVVIRYTISPDELRASQTKQSLSLASQTLEYMRGGLSTENCQAVCQLLLPETRAMSVAMTDDKVVLGYAGRYAEDFPIGSPIHTEATHQVLATQTSQVFSSSRSTGTNDLTVIPAGIVAPLVVRGKSVGTLKMYYEAPHLIDETQVAISDGFAELLSTQLSIAELDRQVELATKAELQALQSQINPHFLFNTINTIASLIRTEPMRARDLLREFAKFYRQTLENSDDPHHRPARDRADHTLPALRGRALWREAHPPERARGAGPRRGARARIHHPAHRGELGEPRHAPRGAAHHRHRRDRRRG